MSRESTKAAVKRRRFDKAYIIALLGQEEEPITEELLPVDGMAEHKVIGLLEELVSEGWVERIQYPTYCHKCGSDDGVEYRYQLIRKEGKKG